MQTPVSMCKSLNTEFCSWTLLCHWFSFHELRLRVRAVTAICFAWRSSIRLEATRTYITLP
eukprot:scaffold482852_cov46-Prasinocladus_malaysianus.AAC.2